MNDRPPDVEPFRLLFVCTGNTCRSPMAAEVARREIAKRGWTHVIVESAGLAASHGSPASPGAVRAVSERHGSLSDHRSRPLTPEVLEGADLILAMTPAHVAHLVDLGVADRTALLTAFAAGQDAGDTGGVSDPFGGPDELYRTTLDELTDLVERSLARLEPILAP